MSRKAIIHIGPMKTGSTSIQAWLHARRQELLDAGFLFPVSLRSRNMSSLSYVAQSMAAGNDVSEADAARITALREEIASLPASVSTVIFSGEMIGQQLKSRAEVQALKTLFDEFFADYLIILYLRRQDELSLSLYSTALRRGSKRAQTLGSPLDYRKILDPWTEVFTRGAICPRLFDRDLMPDGDVVQDFAMAAGLPGDTAKAEPIHNNPSLLPPAQTFLAELAANVKAAGFGRHFMNVSGHEMITRHLNRNFKGKGAKPARAEVVAFYDPVRESNERIRQEWFPDRATLFSENFDDYPEAGTPAPTAEQILEVAMSVLTKIVTRPMPGEPADAAGDPAGPRRVRRKKRKETRASRKGQGKARGRRSKSDKAEL